MTHNPHLWYLDDPEIAKVRHRLAFEYVKAIENAQWGTRQRQFRNAYLYCGEAPHGSWKVQWRSAPRYWRKESVTEGVMESVMDTAISMIGADANRVTFQTDNADWSTRRRAIWQARYTEGQFTRVGLADSDPLLFRDALWGMAGISYWDHDGENPRCTRINPLNFIVDERAAATCPPTQVAWVEFMDRDQAAAELQPRDKDAIKHATSEYVWFVAPGPTMIARLRTWKLPWRKMDGTLMPGRYLDCTDRGVIEEKEWNYPGFPMTFYKWKDPITGWWGRCIADILAWPQGWRNKRLRHLAYAQDMSISPKVLMAQEDRGAGVAMTNEVGQHIYYKRTPPQFVTPPAVAPEVYQDLDRNYNHMYALPGISQFQATGKKPGGLDSAPGQREFHANELGRFTWQVGRFERVKVEHARQLMRVSKELHELGKTPEATWKSKNLARRIPWKDVDPVDDAYVISLEPASILSRTPAGRVQQVVELAQAGLLDRASSLRLVGHPDFERIVKLYDAPFDDIEATIEDLAAQGDRKPPPFPTPERYQDLKLGLTLVQLAYLQTKRDGAPDIPVLESFRRWMRLAEIVVARGTPAPAPAAAAPQPLPGGPPPPQATMAAGGAPPQIQGAVA